VSYQSSVKFSLLEVPVGPVVSLDSAAAMAAGVKRLLNADVGLATTGVAGPDPQDGVDPGTVFVGLALADEPPIAEALQLFGVVAESARWGPSVPWTACATSYSLARRDAEVERRKLSPPGMMNITTNTCSLNYSHVSQWEAAIDTPHP